MLTNDRIHLRDYEVSADIGAFQSEKGRPQRLLFSVSVDLADTVPDIDDQVDRILSYDLLVHAVDSALADRRYNLLETLAEKIAEDITQLPRVGRVDVRIEKLDRVQGALGISITRQAAAPPALHQRPRLDVLVWPGKVDDPAHGLVILPDHIPHWDGTTNHQRQIALLSIDQAAWTLGAELKLDVVSTITELAAAAKLRQQVVWAPARLVSDHPAILPSSLALAHFLTTQLDVQHIHLPPDFSFGQGETAQGLSAKLRRAQPTDG